MTWRDLAACRAADTALFFPDSAVDAGPALTFCRTCPVLLQCRAEIEDTPSWLRCGVWGGRFYRMTRERGRGRQLQPCGTNAAYQRHVRAGEQACAPCLRANAERAARYAYRSAA